MVWIRQQRNWLDVSCICRTSWLQSPMKIRAPNDAKPANVKNGCFVAACRITSPVGAIDARNTSGGRAC